MKQPQNFDDIFEESNSYYFRRKLFEQEEEDEQSFRFMPNLFNNDQKNIQKIFQNLPDYNYGLGERSTNPDTFYFRASVSDEKKNCDMEIEDIPSSPERKKSDDEQNKTYIEINNNNNEKNAINNNNSNSENNDNSINHNDETKIKFKTEKKSNLGRKLKNDKTSERNHTRLTNDNASKKFIKAGGNSYHNYIKSTIKPYLKNSDEFKLHKPNFIKYLPSKAKEKPEYFKKSMKFFYENYSEPKNAKDKDMYRIANHNILKKLDEFNDNKLSRLITPSFEECFLAFLNDEKIINDNLILNGHFKTLKDCFNNIEDESDYYTEEEKERIKEYCTKLIIGEIKGRKGRND